ncbi:TRAP transporter substrate-binding protein [Salinarimonas ramus]|uniref:ABC transporter substrate-binding protein n=1 Tax=Salinarimonas ramus TaxID=690164 RepID=A0A917QJZ4_9HYPH|nr:TRAP transporter substrate-binding protein [Salinarimonas ramus]GGK53484.1 ABC transporter substrate-binding protein [Salinarimonas ramus]
MTKNAGLRTTALVATLAATALVAAPRDAAAEFDSVRWQIPMSFASTLTALGDTMPWVSEAVSAVSGGEVTLQVMEPGTLIPPLTIFENASNGNIDAGYSWMGYERGQVPASALFGATPFGLDSPGFIAWMYFGEGDQLLKETFEPYGVYPILCGSISPEASGWFRNEIASVSDLQGLKFRAAGVGGEIMEELQMSVTLLPGGELYQALETGVLDATEFSLPTVDEQLGFFQVAKYYYLPGWHQPSTNQFLYVNIDAWNDLNDQTKALIETTCTAGVTMAMAKAEALQGAVLSRFQEQGVNLVVWSDDFLDTFWEATQNVMARLSEEDAQFGKVHDSMRAFQREHAEWYAKGYLPRDWAFNNIVQDQQ